MRRLSEKFRADGFDFKVLERRGRVVLLEKTKPGWSRPAHEIVILQVRPAETIRGKQYPEREVMPPTESWGTYGWTPYDLANARLLFERASELCFKGQGTLREAFLSPGKVKGAVLAVKAV